MKLAKDPIVKTCFKCGEPKLLKEFYRHPQMKDGRVNKCKECNKKDVSRNYRKNNEYYTQYERDRAQRPERKAWANEFHKKKKAEDPERYRGYQRSYREKNMDRIVEKQRTRRAENPEAYRAYLAVQRALRSGTLRKESCACGEKDAQAHHHDYSKPLDVQWLCCQCHADEHVRLSGRAVLNG